MSNDTPLESSIETYLSKRVKDLGGKCLKFVSPGTAGVPDRLVLLPHGVAAFVELKRLGEVPAPLQVKFARDMLDLGHRTYWANNQAAVDSILGTLSRLVHQAAEERGKSADRLHRGATLLTNRLPAAQRSPLTTVKAEVLQGAKLPDLWIRNPKVPQNG